MLVFSLHKWIILADENAYGKDGQRFHCIIFCIMIGIIVGVFIFISLLTYKVHFWMACCWCLSMLLHKFMMHVSMDLCINHLISYCVWIIIYYFWIIFILIGNPLVILHVCTMHQWWLKHFIIHQMHKYIIRTYN